MGIIRSCGDLWFDIECLPCYFGIVSCKCTLLLGRTPITRKSWGDYLLVLSLIFFLFILVNEHSGDAESKILVLVIKRLLVFWIPTI